MQSPGFEPAKAAANAAFREGRHQAAVAGYTRALSLVLHVNAADAAVCLSNRSLVQLKLGRKREALFDAEQAVAMRPTWSKAMFRLHSALVALGRSADARLVSARAKELKAVEVLGAEGAGEQEQELPGALSSAAGRPRTHAASPAKWRTTKPSSSRSLKRPALVTHASCPRGSLARTCRKGACPAG